MPAELTAEIHARTATRKPVRLPVGAESSMSEQEVRAWMAENPEDDTLRVMIRCPGAANPAPYDVDVSDLLFAIEKE